MRKVYLFLILTTVSLGSLVSLFLVSMYLAANSPTSSAPSWMQQMWQQWGMGGWMNGHNMHQPSTTSPYLWTIPTVLAGVALASTGGLAYFLLFPEIKTAKPVQKNLRHDLSAAGPVDKNAQRDPIPAQPILGNSELGKPVEPVTQKSSLDPYAAVLRTLTPEERKVVEVLASHDGKYLQKYIRREAGLSRLKTHRILARLADRGMVSLEKSGNTNEVVLSDWLKINSEGAPPRA